jgi:hypothetical protein
MESDGGSRALAEAGRMISKEPCMKIGGIINKDTGDEAG